MFKILILYDFKKKKKTKKKQPPLTGATASQTVAAGESVRAHSPRRPYFCRNVYLKIYKKI